MHAPHPGMDRPPALSRAHHDTLDEWQADRRRWRETCPVTATLAEGLPIESSSQTHTATTDGQRLLVNPAWSAGLSPTARAFLQAHLVWHAAAGHYRSTRRPNLRHWHLACDHAVNTQLLRLGHPLPEQGAVLFPPCAAMGVSEVYDWLARHPSSEEERSLDQFVPQDESREARAHLPALWTRRIQATVKEFIGTPWLPNAVAAWLLACR